jgi:hypothetical protein
MAKATCLQVMNKIMSNLGETQLSSLTGLSGLSLLAFNALNEFLYDIAFKDRYTPLEADGTITLVTSTATYSKPTDMFAFDKDSFRYDDSAEVVFYTPQRFDREYKAQTDVGIPNKIYQWTEYWKPYPIPGTSANTKTIKYRYWKFPTVYSTATPTGTSWIPEGFDITLLADYVTYKIMHYKENAQAPVYYAKVYGDGRENEGSLSMLKSLYRSPQVAEGSLVVEPMEGGGSSGSARSIQGY